MIDTEIQPWPLRTLLNTGLHCRRRRVLPARRPLSNDGWCRLPQLSRVEVLSCE